MSGSTAKKKTILVTGASGQLGRSLQAMAHAYPQFTFVFFDRSTWPIEDLETGQAVFTKHQPFGLINCAAYTAVDKAESEEELAFAINADAPAILAALCQEFGTRFIHISTDYVFDGDARRPYSEDDRTHPQSVYGASKLTGEELVRKNCPSAVVIRSSWVYSPYGKNFVVTILRLLSEKKEVRVVNDQFGSPTYAPDLAAALLHIMDGENWKPGIYHFCNQGVITWFDFAVAINELNSNKGTVLPIPTSEYPTAAKRPSYSALDTRKIAENFSISLIPWRESLQHCLQALRDHSS